MRKSNDDKKDYLNIRDSKDRLDVIIEEYCTLLEDKQMQKLLFKNVEKKNENGDVEIVQHAATTNQNLIADAAAYTTPELLQNKQAYLRHRLAEEALWLWCVVYCMRRVWQQYVDRGTIPSNRGSLTSEEVLLRERYREATWDGVIEGVSYSLNKIREDIAAHFADEKNKNEKFRAKNVGSLKKYVFNMADCRSVSQYEKRIWKYDKIFIDQKKSDGYEKENGIEKHSDHSTEHPMEQDDKVFLKIFKECFEQLDKDSEIHIEKIKSDDSIDWLADYIENNRKSFEMVIRNVMREESYESIGKRFGVSRDTVRRRIKDFLKDMRDRIC